MSATPTAATKALVASASAALLQAYAPYSNYRVGAALLTRDGSVYTGCNVENAAYPATICAERTALVKAVSEGQRQFDAIAVVTSNGGFPCGLCRQMLYEFSPKMRVIVAEPTGKIIQEAKLSDLLPHGFGPSYLEH
ncbi:MAG: cytidine deaminase [Anaerolineae bacterium]|nr:cytidine deaminase [Anaerolineae bacterium]